MRRFWLKLGFYGYKNRINFQVVECVEEIALCKCAGDIVSTKIQPFSAALRDAPAASHKLLCCVGQQEKWVWVRVIRAHTHTLWRVKAPLQKKRRSIRHPQPWAILHLAGTLRWQTVAWVSTCFTVQKDNSVIICGPDLEPHNTDLVLSSIKPTGENYQVPFLEVSCHYKRERTVEWSIWYEAVQTQKPLQRVFICQTSRFGSGNKTEKSD